MRDDLERVTANMKGLALAKRRLGSDKPKVVYKMLLNRHNQHEVEAARTIAEDCGADFWPDDSFWCPEGVSEDWLVDRKEAAPPQGFTPLPVPNEVVSTYCASSGPPSWPVRTATCTPAVFSASRSMPSAIF